MANYGHRDDVRPYSDEDYYGQSGYYDRDYERDYGRGYNREYGRGTEYRGTEYRGEVGVYERGPEYRGDYGQGYARDYTRASGHDQGRDHGGWMQSGTGIGAGAAVLALAAFGIGWLVGTRWHAETHERIGGMPRSDLRPSPTLDDYHGHVSINDPDAPAGTPPDANEVVGSEPSGKSARESAETLKDADGKQGRPRETATAGSDASSGTSNGGRSKS